MKQRPIEKPKHRQNQFESLEQNYTPEISRSAVSAKLAAEAFDTALAEIIPPQTIKKIQDEDV